MRTFHTDDDDVGDAWAMVANHNFYSITSFFKRMSILKIKFCKICSENILFDFHHTANDPREVLDKILGD